MKILIVGAGSTGGYFGARLAAAGRDVTFLVREKRQANLARIGLRVVSPKGEFTVKPKTVTASTLASTFDVVIVAVKGAALAKAAADFAPAVGAHTMILPFLNGMRHLATLRSLFGAERVMGCVCKVAASLDEHGDIIQLSELHDVTYGEFSGISSERLVALDNEMSGAGFETHLSIEIEQEMWNKWVLMASVGAITCLFRGNIGEIGLAEMGDALKEQILDEALATARSEGFDPAPEYRAGLKAALLNRHSAQTSSMYRDMMNGQPVEVEPILGDFVKIAARNGIGTPLLNAAYLTLNVYQSHLDRQRPQAA